MLKDDNRLKNNYVSKNFGMSKRILSFFIIFSILFVTIPSVGLAKQPDYNSGVTIQAKPYTLGHEIRVAIYDEDNTTIPSYVTNIGETNNNVSYLVDIFAANEKITTTLLTADDIDTKVLTTVNYDVLILPDNYPREKITNEIMDFWLAGGGIMTFDGSASFLAYFGILPAESAGDDGYPIYWTYGSDGFDFESRHPISKEYSLTTEIAADGGYGYCSWDWIALSGTTIFGDIIPIAQSIANSNMKTIIAFDPSYRGGKVVSVGWDLAHEPIPELEELIIDSVDWLAPQPKGRILYDLSHQPRLGIDDWDLLTIFPGYYIGMRDYLVSLGYTVDKLYPSLSGDNITTEILEKYDILISVSPDYNYTSSELTTLEEWISEGGSLFAAVDNPFMTFEQPTDQQNKLLAPFGMNVIDGLSSATSIVDNFPHPILESCVAFEASFYGYINISGSAFPIWYDGPNLNIVAAANEFGEGRVVVTSDINWFQSVGDLINHDNNRQFLRNIANWLTSKNADVLIYTDNPWAVNYYRNALSLALKDLGVKFHITSGGSGGMVAFNQSLHLYDWKLVIIDNPSYFGLDAYFDDIEAYVDSGGRLIMSYFDIDSHQNHTLWGKLGMEYSGDFTTEPPLYIWDTEHKIFNNPHAFNSDYFDNTESAADEGDTFTLINGATAVAGLTLNEEAGEAIIVLSKNKKTLYNGYLIDMFNGDSDDSAYKDNYELWKNELVFMLDEASGFFGLGLPDWAWYAMAGGLVLIVLIIIIASVASRAKKKRTN
ncbi:MAG TPA: DUF4350 domain-containing protein [Candidatus Bathyarchaeia archaeon]|nr:DUF4350 domain-containing protein [Candidatus Bathyarchaeia archaeon]